MLIYAIGLFAVAAAGGVLLATSVLRKRLAPWALSLLHALLGAAGLILLLALIVRGGASSALISGFALLLVAALGGFVLAAFHVRQKVAPKALVLTHAGAAIIGFFILLRLTF